MEERYVVEKGYPHPSEDQEYFFKRSIQEPNSGCWIWLGPLDHNGYGTSIGRGRPHRASLGNSIGRKLSKTEYACHKCDNPTCVNHEHLYVGNALSNSQDRKNRFRTHSLLKKEDVLYILRSTEKQKDLAKRFSVSQATISTIKRGKTFSHVTPI